MATPRDINARRYYRVAYQRLEDGRLMLHRLVRPKAAIYLTGYAVECIGKALLLEISPATKRGEVLKSFRGPGGHDLLWIRARLAQRGLAIPAMIAREWAYVASWSVELRYEPGNGDVKDA